MGKDWKLEAILRPTDWSSAASVWWRGHRGLAAVDGISILFGGQHEFVVTYAPSLNALTPAILSEEGTDLENCYGHFRKHVLESPIGNAHV